MFKSKKIIAVVITALLAVSVLAGCGNSGGGSASDEGERTEIRIGMITPLTGVLAGFGEGTPWTEELLVDYVNNELGGIEVDGKKLPIKLISYDSESDTTKCAELAQKLITDDKVDMMVVRHTPETVNPVSAVCERYEIPTVSMDAPVDAWLAEGPYEWVFHTHWNLDTMYKQYKALWEKAGATKGTKIGIIFANDADGTAWKATFADQIKADGFELVDPGQYPAGTTDFTDIINQFKTEGVEILAGTNTNPDFGTFWRQSKQQGFEPKFVTMGKAYLLRADAEAIGADLMNGLTGEVWWSPVHPFKSALTGETPASLTELYLEASDREITQPMGYKYASFEVAIDALTRAGTLDKPAIRDAIAATDIETVIGPVKYNDEHYSLSPLTGGQWVVDSTGTLQLNIVDNSLAPEIPLTGELQLLK